MKKLVLSFTALIAFQAKADINLSQAFTDVTLEKPACFTRSYSADHLRRHPRQTVQQIKIKLRQWQYGERANEVSPVLAIQVKRKKENKVWTNNITCMDNEEKKTVLCAVECDGGSVEILARDADGKMILKNNGVLLYGGCGAGEDQETIFLQSRPGGDDVFLLRAANASVCADISDEAY